MARQWPSLPRGAETYSVTAFHDWTCWFRGHQKRDLRRKEPESPALREGRVLHDVISAYLGRCLEQGVQTDVTAIEEIVRQAFFGPEPSGLPDDAYPSLLDTARKFAGTYVVDVDRLAHLEEPWAVPLARPDRPGFENAYMWVILDACYLGGSTAVVEDFKTDWYLRAQEDVEGDLQLRVYCWGVAQVYRHVEEFECRLNFMRHGKVRSVTFDRSVVEETDELIRARVEQIRAARKRGEFPAVPGSHCQWCGFASECPALKQATALPITDDRAAQAAAGELLALERRADELREALKAYTAETGSIVLEGVELGHFLTESATVDDVGTLAQRLSQAGLDPYAYLQPVAAKLRALTSTDEGLELVGDLLVDRSYTRFATRKAKAVAAR
jgi:hypothetical protein